MPTIIKIGQCFTSYFKNKGGTYLLRPISLKGAAITSTLKL